MPAGRDLQRERRDGVQRSDVEVSPYESTVDTPPRSADGDLRLTSGSPAIDAADPEYAPKTDRDGNPRDGAPDAGAYEYE